MISFLTLIVYILFPLIITPFRLFTVPTTVLLRFNTFPGFCTFLFCFFFDSLKNGLSQLYLAFYSLTILHLHLLVIVVIVTKINKQFFCLVSYNTLLIYKWIHVSGINIYTCVCEVWIEYWLQTSMKPKLSLLFKCIEACTLLKVQTILYIRRVNIIIEWFKAIRNHIYKYYNIHAHITCKVNIYICMGGGKIITFVVVVSYSIQVLLTQ